jgi:hypothetical protein
MRKLALIIAALIISGSVLAQELPLPSGAKYSKKDGINLIEYCPDNTCNKLTTEKPVSNEELNDLTVLYFYYVGAYIYLDKPIIDATPYRVKYKKLVNSTLEKYKNKCVGNKYQKASCALELLSNKSGLKLQFVRYDEGGEFVTDLDIAQEISVKNIQKNENWYKSQ